MKAQNIKIGATYFHESIYGIEFVKVLLHDPVMGYWVKDPDGECFWTDAEELEEV